MHVVQITPGAGGMYCGLCIRDNALVGALRKLGHHVVMVPLYLPFTLDEEDQSAGTPIFFGGINVYLEQKSSFFRSAPKWFHRLLASRGLLKWIGAKAAGTRPEHLGDITLSMLRGEEGHQAQELNDLITWLKTQPKPDVISLSTGLLIGMARRLRSELDVPVMCMFQGEDVFLDALSPPYREQCWNELTTRAKEISLIASPSRYFAGLMANRLSLDPRSVVIAPNGINLEGFNLQPAGRPSPRPDGESPPVIGYFARMCADKGLDLLVDAYIQIRKSRKIDGLKLKIGGSCGPIDEKFVNGLRARLSQEGVLDDVEFCPNPDHPGKIGFLRSLSVFSVPARFGEAFGLYVIEALAAGVPVVQPQLGAFPELVEATGGGLLYDPKDPRALADTLQQLLLDPVHRRALGDAGRATVAAKYSSQAMANQMLGVFQQAAGKSASGPSR